MRFAELTRRAEALVAWVLRSEVWLYAVPVLVYLVVTRGTGRVDQLLLAMLGVGVVLVASRHPLGSFCVALIFVSVQQVVVPLLWSWGLPAGAARGLSWVRDALLLALLANALMTWRRRRTALDVVDKLALAFVGIVVMYLLVPGLFRPVLPTTLSTRLIAFRFDAGYVLVFLAFRHADLPGSVRRRFRQVLLALAALMAGGAVYQHLAPGSWQNFVLETAGVARYRVEVLNIDRFVVRQSLTWMTDLHRAGSFLISPHEMAHLLIVPFAFVVERIVRGHRRFDVVVVVLIGLALLYSRTRANAIAMLLMLALVLVPRRGRTTTARIGFAFLLLSASLLVVPAILGTRFTGAEGGAESSKDHVDEIRKGFEIMGRHPLGTGLGNGPSTADRALSFEQQGLFTTSDFLTQVGDEFGIHTLAVYVVFLSATGAALVRRGREDPFASATSLAFVGLCVTGVYHHVFVTFAPAWALWAAVGIALRPAPAQRDPKPVPTATGARV